MKRTIQTLFTFAFIAALLNGCNLFPSDDLFPDVSKYTIYVAGQYSKEYERISCYWKNGVKTDLLGDDSFVSGIFVENGTVFICGSYTDWTSDDHFELPCYWANKKLVELPGAERWDEAVGIFVE
jgi:hypothetical protein